MYNCKFCDTVYYSPAHFGCTKSMLWQGLLFPSPFWWHKVLFLPGFTIPLPIWLHKVHFVTGFIIPLPILIARSPFCARVYYFPTHFGCTKYILWHGLLFPCPVWLHKVHFVTLFTIPLPMVVAQSSLATKSFLWQGLLVPCQLCLHKVNFVQIAIVFKESL